MWSEHQEALNSHMAAMSGSSVTLAPMDFVNAALFLLIVLGNASYSSVQTTSCLTAMTKVRTWIKATTSLNDDRTSLSPPTLYGLRTV